MRVLASGNPGREAVLGLPLSRLIVKLVRVPAGEDPVAVATPVLQALSPYPDEPVTVSCETVRETGEGLIVLAAALPEGATDDLAEALDARKLSITRVDALVLGQLRGIWSRLGPAAGRRLLIFRSVDCLSLLVLEEDQPLAVRAIRDASELRRELMLSLLEAEDFGGAGALTETIVVSVDDVEGLPEVPDSELEAFGAVRHLAIGADAALVGVGERSSDPAAFNALPASWAEVLAETRFKRSLICRLSIAGGIWLLVMTVLLGVPKIYGYLTGRQEAQTSAQHAKYREVVTMREKVNTVRRYSDHASGALETLRRVSENLPEGITLSSWTFIRDSELRFAGVADAPSLVYELTNKMKAEFAKVSLRGPSTGNDGKQKFEIDVNLSDEEEDE